MLDLGLSDNFAEHADIEEDLTYITIVFVDGNEERLDFFSRRSDLSSNVVKDILIRLAQAQVWGTDVGGGLKQLDRLNCLGDTGKLESMQASSVLNKKTQYLVMPVAPSVSAHVMEHANLLDGRIEGASIVPIAIR